MNVMNGRGLTQVAARFMIGRNHQGLWVVDDCLGRLGGVFISESAALSFALHEADHDQAMVRVAPGDKLLELRFPKGNPEGARAPSL